MCLGVCGCTQLDAPDSTVTVGQVPTPEQLARQECSVLHKPVASHTHNAGVTRFLLKDGSQHQYLQHSDRFVPKFFFFFLLFLGGGEAFSPALLTLSSQAMPQRYQFLWPGQVHWVNLEMVSLRPCPHTASFHIKCNTSLQFSLSDMPLWHWHAGATETANVSDWSLLIMQ